MNTHILNLTNHLVQFLHPQIREMPTEGDRRPWIRPCQWAVCRVHENLVVPIDNDRVPLRAREESERGVNPSSEEHIVLVHPTLASEISLMRTWSRGRRTYLKRSIPTHSRMIASQNPSMKSKAAMSLARESSSTSCPSVVERGLICKMISERSDASRCCTSGLSDIQKPSQDVSGGPCRKKEDVQ